MLPAGNPSAGDLEAYDGNYDGNFEGAGSLGKRAPYSPVSLTDSFAQPTVSEVLLNRNLQYLLHSPLNSKQYIILLLIVNHSFKVLRSLASIRVPRKSFQ